MAIIGGDLYTRHQEKLNHVNKDVSDILSVILVMGADVHGGKTVFLNGITMNDIGRRVHVFKNSHETCALCAFDKSNSQKFT